MLGKRSLVDYSDEEGEINDPQVNESQAPGVESVQTIKKKIPYSRLPSPFPNLLSSNIINTISEEVQQQKSKANQKIIEFETVSGTKFLALDAPRDKVWKGSKKEREPFYYTAFKEIYKDEIEKKIGGTLERVEEQEKEEKKDGSVFREIRQQDLIQFDYEKYKEIKERKDLLLEDKTKRLRVGDLNVNHEKFKTKAIEQLEKEAVAQVMGTPQEEGMKRNKKQYGF